MPMFIRQGVVKTRISRIVHVYLFFQTNPSWSNDRSAMKRLYFLFVSERVSQRKSIMVFTVAFLQRRITNGRYTLATERLKVRMYFPFDIIKRQYIYGVTARTV